MLPLFARTSSADARYSAPGHPKRLAPDWRCRPWNVSDLLASHTSSVVAWFQGLDGRHVTAFVSPEAAQRLYQGGITFYIRQAPAFAPLTEAIATALTVPTQHVECTLFCNQPGACTRMHFDPIDTITMQATGSKRRRLAPNLHAPYPTVSYATCCPGTCASVPQPAGKLFAGRGGERQPRAAAIPTPSSITSWPRSGLCNTTHVMLGMTALAAGALVYPIYPQHTRNLPPKCQQRVRCSRHCERTFLRDHTDSLPGTCLAAGPHATRGQRAPVTDHRAWRKRVGRAALVLRNPAARLQLPHTIHA